MEFGAVPCRLTGLCPAGDAPAPFLTLFTSMFLHGGFLHIAGNMLYLWIFGDNVEDTLGHGRFLLFYLLSGVAAALAQIVVHPDSSVPMVGASGAVSGVLGAYLLLFPYARVLVLLIFGFFVRIVRWPATVVLGFWIVVQFLNGLITVSVAAGGAAGGTAWFAHIGGFVAGIVLLFLMRPRRTGRL
jgi:membrane associated rhomboid family serine protease